MPQISNLTLQIAIRVVADEIRTLRAELAAGGADPRDWEYLEQHLKAADDLERAYDIEARTVLNLIPYDELVGDQ